MAEEEVAPPLEAAALMALAHPSRFRLWELLDEHGPVTAIELAKLAGAHPVEVADQLSELAELGTRVVEVIKDFRARDSEKDEPTARVEVFFHAFPIGFD